MNHNDARVRYTRMMIEQSFLELLKQKPVSRVTVTELCEKAGINRATFYKHYLDVPDLLEQIEAELFRQIRLAFQTRPTEMKAFLVEMLQYTYRERDRFYALGGENGDPELMTKTFLICYESAYPLLKENLPQIPEDQRQMLYQFLSQGAGGVLNWWVRNGMRVPVEEVAQFVLGLSSAAATCVDAGAWRTAYHDA